MSKSIVEHINNISLNKTAPNTYTESDWKSWSSFMINRWLSMNSGLVELVNEIQSLNITDKKQLYKLYLDILPKKRVFAKYIKSTKVEKHDPEVVAVLAQHFEIGKKEIKSYLDQLSRSSAGMQFVQDVLLSYGKKLEKK